MRWRRAVLILGALWVAGQLGWIALGPNFHAVVPGQFYRSGQPSAAHVEQWIRTHGIRTIINLRGPNPERRWHQQEVRVAQRFGVAHFDIAMSSHHKPEKKHFSRLIRTLEEAERPILVHCGQGSDRAGFATACFLLLCTDASPAQASRQLSLRYGHIPLGRPAVQDALLRLYDDWLAGAGLVHQPKHLKTWVNDVYQKDDWNALEPGDGCCLHQPSWQPPMARRFDPEHTRRIIPLPPGTQ